MAGNLAGGAKHKKTMIALFGTKEYSNIMAAIGSIGGSKTHAQGAAPKGFAAMSPELRSAAGKKGGTISRRRAKHDQA